MNIILKTAVSTVILLCISLVSFSQTTQQTKELAAEIDRLAKIDQQVQIDTMQAITSKASEERVKELVKIQADTFKNHIPILKEIIRKYGYPTISLVGKQASFNFWLMVQHADTDVRFQKYCLKLMKKYLNTKEVSGENYAYLTDRVNKNSGKKQVYGTQFEHNEKGVAQFPKNLIDPKNVNKRRAKVGLNTLEEYISKYNDFIREINEKATKTETPKQN
jgi:hypothetical protein